MLFRIHIQIIKLWPKRLGIGLLVLGLIALVGCSTMKSIFVPDQSDNSGPISNPFADYSSRQQTEPSPGMIIRTNKGPQQVEIELPRNQDYAENLEIPLSSLRDQGRNRAPASLAEDVSQTNPGEYGQFNKEHPPTMSDREIEKSFANASSENEARQTELEKDLYLTQSDEGLIDDSVSYLARLDRIKQLYHIGRYEAALVETDETLRLFPTDSTLYEMRGTLLNRLGKTELALKSWNQALRLEPKNASLRKFLERKQMVTTVTPP